MLLIVISIFILILTLILGVGILINEKKKVKTRIDKFVDISNTTNQKKNNKKNEKSYITNFLKDINNKKRKSNKIGKTEKLLINSDVGLSIEEFNAIRIIIILILTIIFYFIFKNIKVIIIVPVFWIIPVLFLNNLKKRRVTLFEKQLGDAISILANSLKAGYSYMQAVNSVAKDMPDPVGKEFKILLKEMSLGVNASEALDNLTSRVDSKDLSLMITAIKIQRETGGNLAEILSNISETIRERIKIQGEIKTLTAQGRMSGMVIGLMPVALILVLLLINKEYISVLFNTGIGKILLISAVISELIGAFFIKKIVDIDV
ncbi:type II secretion system F family protein [Clostridiaceae bacterium HSG29]|nr:type II secretion system F family protein [Clostridiaceae bacterium HSG29]